MFSAVSVFSIVAENIFAVSIIQCMNMLYLIQNSNYSGDMPCLYTQLLTGCVTWTDW